MQKTERPVTLLVRLTSERHGSRALNPAAFLGTVFLSYPSVGKAYKSLCLGKHSFFLKLDEIFSQSGNAVQAQVSSESGHIYVSKNPAFGAIGRCLAALPWHSAPRHLCHFEPNPLIWGWARHIY